MFPKSFHPVYSDELPDRSGIAPYISRSKCAPTYYYSHLYWSVVGDVSLISHPVRPPKCANPVTIPELAAVDIVRISFLFGSSTWYWVSVFSFEFVWLLSDLRHLVQERARIGDLIQPFFLQLTTGVMPDAHAMLRMWKQLFETRPKSWMPAWFDRLDFLYFQEFFG